jgi:hypothetical protein
MRAGAKRFLQLRLVGEPIGSEVEPINGRERRRNGMELDRRAQDGLPIEWPGLLGYLVQDELERDHRLAAKDASVVDEAPGGHLVVIRPRAKSGLSRDEIGTIDRPGR